MSDLASSRTDERTLSIDREGGSKERTKVTKASSGLNAAATMGLSGDGTDDPGEQGSLSNTASADGYLAERLRTGQLNVDIHGELLGDVGGGLGADEAVYEGSIGVISGPDQILLGSEPIVNPDPNGSAGCAQEE
jgi:hypothetical protein